MTATSEAILITGASGGFGREFARQLETHAGQLLLTGRDESRLAQTAAQLRWPRRHRIITADLSCEEGIERLLSEIEASDTPLCGLVNNAGFGLWGAFSERTTRAHAELIATDLTAPMWLTHALLPTLRRNRGFIINVSSLAGESPLPWMSGYGAAKAGLTSWSEALRTELRGDVRVVTLAPGPSPTGFRQVSGMPDMLGEGMRTSVEEMVAAAIKTLQHGGGFCVPGWRHRMIWLLQKLTPRGIACALTYRYLRPR